MTELTPHWLIVTKQGVIELIIPDRGVHPIDDGYAEDCAGNVVVHAPRAPHPEEVWDFDVSGLTACANRSLIEEHRKILVRFSDASQVEVWRDKEAEAFDLVNGFPAGPFLTAEAAATGVDILELAKKILDRSRADRELLLAAKAQQEAQRRAAKLARQ